MNVQLNNKKMVITTCQRGNLFRIIKEDLILYFIFSWRSATIFFEGFVKRRL